MPQRNSNRTDKWELFKQALLGQSERRPEGTGWLTFAEMMKKLGMKEGRLRKALAKNKSSYDSFIGLSYSNGRLTRNVWYRPKP